MSVRFGEIRVVASNEEITFERLFAESNGVFDAMMSLTTAMPSKALPDGDTDPYRVRKTFLELIPADKEENNVLRSSK